MYADLLGKVILVTGASGLVGSAVCELLSVHGAKLVLQYHNNEAGAKALARVTGGLPIAADLREEADVRELFARTIDEWGEIYGCVACAGTRPAEEVRFTDLSVEQWVEHCNNNLLMTFLTAREFCRHTKAVTDASLVFIGASSGDWGNPGRAHFAAAKSAISHGLLQSLTDEIVISSRRGRVNAIVPGAIRSGEEGESRASNGSRALPDAPSAEDIAQAALWLLSPRCSGAITGQLVRIDSGQAGRPRRPARQSSAA